MQQHAGCSRSRLPDPAPTWWAAPRSPHLDGAAAAVEDVYRLLGLRLLNDNLAVANLQKGPERGAGHIASAADAQTLLRLLYGQSSLPRASAMQPSNVCREAAGGKHAGPGAGQRACAEHAHVVFHHPLAPLLALEPGRRCRLGPCCCCCCAASCRCRRRRGGPGGHCAAAVTAILCLHVVFRAPGKGSMPGSARQREHARQNVTVKIDATKPGLPPSQGSLHPASAQAPMVVAVPCAGT